MITLQPGRKARSVVATGEMLDALASYDEADALLLAFLLRWQKGGAGDPQHERVSRICKRLSARRARRWHIFILASRREL